MGVVSGIATWSKSASCQQGAYFVLCLCAADTSVMFISIEEVQILALGWLRNDSGHWYKEHLQSLPSSHKSISCSHPHTSLLLIMDFENTSLEMAGIPWVEMTWVESV